MSNLVKLASRLPDSDTLNGLVETRGDLSADPNRMRVAVVYYDVAQITTETDTGARTPTIRVRAVEPLGNPDQLSPEVVSAIEVAHWRRTGKRRQPWEPPRPPVDPAQLSMDDLTDALAADVEHDDEGGEL